MQLHFSSAVFNQILPGPSWPKPVESISDRSAQVCPRRPVRAGLSATAFFSRAVSYSAAQQRQAMQNLFLGRPVTAAQQCQGAQKFFFVLSGQQQGCACRNFFYLFCPVTSPLLDAAQHFSWTFLLCPRTSHACVSGAQIFPDQSLCHPRSKETFFCDFRAAV